MPWPEEDVVVQQGCSSLEELGLFPCSRPTAKVRALIFGLQWAIPDNEDTPLWRKVD